MKSVFPEKYHRYIYLFSLFLLAIGLPISNFFMSLSQIIIICNWVLEGNLKNKLSAFFQNKTALILSSIFLLHIVGLAYTSDFNYAFKDLRIKLPLLVLPLVISTSEPISAKLFNTILKTFVAAIIFGTIASMLALTGIIHHKVVDTRSISIFISHIRFSLLICVAIFVSLYFSIKSAPLLSKTGWLTIILWLIIFLVILESLTGIAVLIITGMALTIYWLATSPNRLIKFGGLFFILFILAGSIYYISTTINQTTEHKKINREELLLYTSRGNLYEHEINSTATENGNLIWVNFCSKELEEAWNKRSTIKFEEKDLNGNNINFTIMRFLASKGGNKDADAIEKLSDNEIKAIERGAANINYQDISSLKGRIHETLWEIDVYRTTGNANGHSLTQRFEYWKTAIGIIKKNLFIGVGTGDVAKAFEEEYTSNNSTLSQQWRLRAHNQYLTIAVTYGVIGFCWFLFAFFYPLFNKKNRCNLIYTSFFIIAAISFFTEDTLETQAGVTFYAFLNTFLLFSKKEQE